MQQTPAHDTPNPDIVRLMESNLRFIVEVGVSSGAIAKAYRQINPTCHYIGIDIDQNYIELAKPHCSEVIVGNIEHFDDNLFSRFKDADCWIFGDVLEHLYDPWALLKKIKQLSHRPHCVIACIPNAQHWSMQARLCSGFFEYQSMGLLDKTHIRFFTRHTMVALFENAGYKITEGIPRIFGDVPEIVLGAIKQMARAINRDPQQAGNDAQPFQWVIKATSEH